MHIQDYPLSNDTPTTKQLILLSLKDGRARTAKEAFAYLKSNHFYGGTYQAIHKGVKELVDEGILLKEGAKYLIAYEWISSGRNFFNELYHNYRQRKQSPEGSDIQVIVVNSFKAFEEFYLHFRDQQVLLMGDVAPENREVYYYVPHCSTALSYSSREVEYIKKIQAQDARAIYFCKSDSIIDRHAQQFYHKFPNSPFKIFVNAPITATPERWVFPTAVVDIYFPPEFIELYDSHYAHATADALEYAKFLEKAYSINQPTQIIVNLNEFVIARMQEESRQKLAELEKK